MTKMRALLHRIAELYSMMFASVMHERVTTYRADAGNEADTDDVGASLRAYIEHARTSAPANPASSPPRAVASEAPAAAQSPPPTHDEYIGNSASPLVSNPLLDYFKKNNTYSQLAPSLSEKLKISAWEHTHRAIRLTHQADYAGARLHADLANNAVHELGHYLSDEDFRAFKSAVKSELLRKA
jgi:hypothetical protein